MIETVEFEFCFEFAYL